MATGINLFFIVSLLAFVEAQQPTCTVPPTFWCDDPSIAQECGVKVQCDAYKQRVSGQKIKLTLLYEALCGGCRAFIRNTLYPQIWVHLQSIVDIEMVPFGNAMINGSKIVCQHGPSECNLNKLESCALNFLEPFNQGVSFIVCMEKQLDKKADPDTARKNCFGLMSLSDSMQRKITDCWRGTLGYKLQLAAASRTNGIGPVKHQYVPWILINNQSTTTMQHMQSLLLPLICEWYQGQHKPPACQQYMTFDMREHGQCQANWIAFG